MGAGVRSGDTSFAVKAGGFSFASSSYDWLMVYDSGTNRLLGAGSIIVHERGSPNQGS